MMISPVIITYGRAAWLERCVRSLIQASQKAPSIQLRVVIFINGTDERSSQVAERLATEFPNMIAEVIQNSERSTPAQARNLALVHLRGDWVLFIDDDAFVDDQYFNVFGSTLSDFPQSVAIGGPNLTPPASSIFQNATGLILSSRLGAFSSFSRYQARGKRRLCGEESLILCNLFVRRDKLSTRPFPEQFLCNEENWLLQTFLFSGYSVVHAPDLHVFHERRASLFLFLKQVFIYGIGRGQNMKMRPRTFRPAHIFPSICTVVGIVALITLTISRHLPPYFIELASIYFFLCLSAVISSFRLQWQGLLASSASLFLFPLLHVSYGLGVLWGLMAFHHGTLRVNATSVP